MSVNLDDYPETKLKRIGEWQQGILSPVKRKGQDESDWERFFRMLPPDALQVISRQENKCILFGRDNSHNSFRLGSKHMKAHRLSYEVFVEPLEDGKVICHKCHKKNCITPIHLYQGTQKDNADDNYKEGGHGADNANENNPMAKLTNRKVRRIRRRFKKGVNAMILAHDNGVSRQTIIRIVRYEAWADADCKWWEFWKW